MQSQYKGYYTTSNATKSNSLQDASNSSDGLKRPLEQYSNNNFNSEPEIHGWENGGARKMFKPEYHDNQDFEYDTGRDFDYTNHDRNYSASAEYDNSHDFEYDSSYSSDTISNSYGYNSDNKSNSYSDTKSYSTHGYRTAQMPTNSSCPSTTTSSSTTSAQPQPVRPPSPPVVLNQPVFQTTHHSYDWNPQKHIQRTSGGNSNANGDILTELWPWEASRSNAGWVGPTVTKQKINFYSGPPADVFATAAKVKGGFGEKMMERMGWSEGEGLGKHRHGTTDLISFDYQRDRKGLRAEEEDKAKVVAVEVKQNQKKSSFTAVKSTMFWKWQGTGMKEDLKTVMKRSRPPKVAKAPEPDAVPTDLSGKHPVSALMELCSKRRWGEPLFNTVSDTGDSHRRKFIMKVMVGGKWYEPSVASDNKKMAKSNAAKHCLQEMGLVPPDHS